VYLHPIKSGGGQGRVPDAAVAQPANGDGDKGAQAQAHPPSLLM